MENTKEIIQFSCQLDGITAKKDKTLSIKLGTQEMGDLEAAELFGYRDKQIWVAFAETTLIKDDLKIKEVVEFPNEKSLSERLRNVLYRVWESKARNKYSDFEVFRKVQMERLISQFKDYIN